MKKLTAILLVFCLAFSTAGYHFFYRFQAWQAKNQMKRQLRNSSRHKEDITEFTFTAEKVEQLEWEDEHEFRFNGHMYDVISKNWKDGKLQVSCIADEKETTLLNHYLKINRENNSGNKTLASLIQIICAQFILPLTVLPDPVSNYFQTQFPSHSSRLASIDYPIHTPPPRFC